MIDKSELLMTALDRYDVRYNATRSGWQAVRCPNEFAHVHGDRNESASIHIGRGAFNCHACDLAGDGYNIVMGVEDVDFITAKEYLGGTEVVREDNWIF